METSQSDSQIKLMHVNVNKYSWTFCRKFWRISWVSSCCKVAYMHYFVGERGGSVVECRTSEREVRGSRPTSAVLCPWARHFTPRKYWLITQEAMAPSRHDWKIVDWDVKPQHNQNYFVEGGATCPLFKDAFVLYPVFFRKSCNLKYKLQKQSIFLEIWGVMRISCQGLGIAIKNFDCVNCTLTKVGETLTWDLMRNFDSVNRP